MAKLTKKQQLFVDEFLIDLNGTQAAIRAGYSPDTAREIASENLTKPNISTAIEKAMAERSRRTGINQDRVLEEIAKIAFVNIADIADQGGRLKVDATREDTAAIQSIKTKVTTNDFGETVEHEIKIGDKLKALELVGKHLGTFSDKLKLEGAIPVMFVGENDLE